MTSQVIFKIDTKVKEKAMKRAKAEGVPFASFLKMATEKYAEGELGIELVMEILPQKMKLLERESRLLDKGKGRRFASLKDAQAFIDSM
jgi:antitoxin component of RelBE/YafQ-DinJ toxin-antitoxin module